MLLDELYDETQTYLVWRTWKWKLWGRSFKEQAKGFSRSTQALAPQSGQALTRPGTLRLHTSRLHKRTIVRATTQLNTTLTTHNFTSFILATSYGVGCCRDEENFFSFIFCAKPSERALWLELVSNLDFFTSTRRPAQLVALHPRAVSPCLTPHATISGD